MPLIVGKNETHLYDAMTLSRPLLTRLIVNCLLSGARSDNATVAYPWPSLMLQYVQAYQRKVNALAISLLSILFAVYFNSQ